MRVVSAIINDIFTDQRVRKQADVLNTLRCNVTIVCRNLSPDISDNNDSFKNIKFSFLINKGPVFYFLYNLRLLIYLLFHRFDLYVANDLDTLLPCYIVSRLRKKPLVYDAHEYFTGQYGLDPHRLPYKTWKRLERYLIPRLTDMITVSDSLAHLYLSEYGVEPAVIRNVAYSSASITARPRSILNIAEDDFLVVIQGAGLNPGRGAVELLEALKVTDGVHLLVIGSGDSINEIKEKASDDSLKTRVSFVPRMPWHEMMSYTKMCDAGLSFDKDLCINQRYSLPNKLFDYISAGIPVIASELPEINNVVRQYNCGITIAGVTPELISKALILMRDDIDLRMRLRNGAVNASKELTWENEKIKEHHFFKTIIESYECKQKMKAPKSIV